MVPFYSLEVSYAISCSSTSIEDSDVLLSIFNMLSCTSVVTYTSLPRSREGTSLTESCELDRACSFSKSYRAERYCFSSSIFNRLLRGGNSSVCVTLVPTFWIMLQVSIQVSYVTFSQWMCRSSAEFLRVSEIKVNSGSGYSSVISVVVLSLTVSFLIYSNYSA